MAIRGSGGDDPAPGEPVDVLVVGGGIAGMVAARELALRGFTVRLAEASLRLGGSVAGHEVAGIPLDAGADSFAARGSHVATLCADLGLRITEPQGGPAWVMLGRGPVPLPATGLLGIPGSPLARDVVRAVGWRGALRAYLDRLRPVLTIGREASLGRLVRTRMGRAVLDALVVPVAGGVYSAHPDDLDVDVVAPGLNAALTRTGSLSGAVSELRSSAAPGSAVRGVDGGMRRLAEALEASLAAKGVAVTTGTRVESVARIPRPGTAAEGPRPEGHRDASEDEPRPGARTGENPGASDDDERPAHLWSVAGTTGQDSWSCTARAVLVAADAATALSLLDQALADPWGEGGEHLATLDWPEPTSVELVTLVIDDARLDTAPRGSGVLVAPSAEGIAAKALTHVTAKWGWAAAAAGPGRHVLRLSYGRAGGPVTLALDNDDEAARTLALRDASALLGVELSPGSVTGFARTVWRDALPFAALGQRARVARVREAVDAEPTLAVCGAWLSGTGLAAVVPDAMGAAGSIRRLDLGV